MPEDRNKLDPKQQDKPQPQTPEHEKTLTEKEEDETGGENRNTPGPIYDV